MEAEMTTAEAAVQEIMTAIESSGAVTDDQLSMLYFMFDKNLERALRILDQGGVQCIISHPGRRSVFQGLQRLDGTLMGPMWNYDKLSVIFHEVIGESKSGPNSYLCFPEHFCSCQSFFFDVVSRNEQLCCKHQLAAKLAKALHRYRDVTVSDNDLAHLLLHC